MKRKYNLTDLDCAGCAAKMEEAVRKIDGVNEVSVSFLAQKMVIDVEEEAVMKKVVKVCKKIEPDCVIEC